MTSPRRDIGAQTTLVLSTISGTVLGTGLKVRALEAGTVSGDVRLLGSDVERLEAKSLSGNIEFDAPLAKGGRYEFTSHSGNVRITLSGNTGFELDADTFSGSVRSDVPVTLRSMGRTEQNRRGSNRAIRGSYGDASAFLSVRSHSRVGRHHQEVVGSRVVSWEHKLPSQRSRSQSQLSTSADSQGTGAARFWHNRRRRKSQ